MWLQCCCWGHISVTGGVNQPLTSTGADGVAFFSITVPFLMAVWEESWIWFSICFTCSFAMLWMCRSIFKGIFVLGTIKLNHFSVHVARLPLPPCWREISPYLSTAERCFKGSIPVPISFRVSWSGYPTLSLVPSKTRQLFSYSVTIILKHNSQPVEADYTLEGEIRVSD